MAETSSQYVINDIPEELRPGRAAILNAALSQVFTPDYLREYFPNGKFPATQQPQPAQPQAPVYFPPPPPQTPSAPPIDPVDYALTESRSSRGGEDEGRMDRGIRQLEAALGYKRGGKIKRRRPHRKAQGGRMSAAADAIDRELYGDDVTLGPGGTPLGGEYPQISTPMPNLPYQIGTGTTGPVSIPPMTAPPQIPGITPGIPGVRPPNQAPPSSGPGMPPGFQPPPTSTGGIEPRFVSQRPANFAGASQAQAAGYNPAQYADESVAQDLARKMGGTVNYTNSIGAIGPPSQASINFSGPDSHNAGLIADTYTRFAGNQSAIDQRLAQIRDEIRQLGGTPTFKKGGVVRLQDGAFPNVEQNPATETNVIGANVAPTPHAAANPFGGNQSALNPYQAYGGQRILNSGNFGQVGANGVFQTSDPTRAGIDAISGLPSYFLNGEIFAGRTDTGEATTPFGIANDMFDASGRLALGASQNAEYMSGLSPLRSSFGDTMNAIRSNPNAFMAGDITVGQLRAPQMDAPGAINPADVTGQFREGYMQPVSSIGSGRFIDPNNPTDYMSPYQRAVTDVRRGDATRAFNEQKQVRDAQMVRAGAFGNSRRAVADSLAARDLNNTLDRITAEGSEGAYLNAQQQYERDEQRRMAAGQSNQRAELEVGGQNLGAVLRGNELRGNTGLQALLANQRAGIDVGGQNLNAALTTQNLSRQSALQAALANQATRFGQNKALLDAAGTEDQLQQQAAQGNFRNALDAIGQQTNSATAASNISQNRADLSRLAQAMEIQRSRELMGAGAGIDARTQSAIDLGYQDFINRRNFPYQQLGWINSMYAGAPMGYNSEGVMFNQTNPAAQWGGLATAGIGALSNYYSRAR